MKRFLAVIFVFVFSGIHAQKINTGVSFGTHIRNNSGYNVVSDSISIISRGSRSMLNVYSIFLEYPITKNIQFRTSLNGTRQLVAFQMYNNKATCQFCDVMKVTVVGSVNINSTNTVAIKVPIKAPVNFLVLGGIRTNFNITRDEPDISFRDGTRHQGLAEAINNMDKTIKPVYFNSVIGIKTDWRRFSLILELDKNLGSSITNRLDMFDQKYTFINRTNTITLIANYKILPWRKS